MNKLQWGIIGTGKIAQTFAGALKEAATGELLGVASRAQETADAFGEEFGVPRRYSSYEAMLADADVRAVYISLPNHLHSEWVVKCAEAGKQILVEKPFATNVAELTVALDAARAHDVFLMEAFMYRCHPQTAKLYELISAKAIGEVRMIQTHFGYNMGPQYDNIRLQNAAAGGAIMDVGCYCASLARLVAGAALGQPFAEPVKVRGTAVIGETSRVDEWATAALEFEGGILANLTCGAQVNMDATARIWGSAGHILVPHPWFPGKGENKIILKREGEGTQEVNVHSDRALYTIEADVVAQNLAARQAPHPAMTWDDSRGNQALLDAWRAEVGLVFDGER